MKTNNRKKFDPTLFFVLLLSVLFVVGILIAVRATDIQKTMGIGDNITASTIVLFGLSLASVAFFATPTTFFLRESKRRANDVVQQAALLRSLAATMRLTPVEFEEEVAIVFTAMTKFNATRVGKSGDNGVDIELRDKQTGAFVGIIQVKQYDPRTPLPPTFIREVYGVKAHTGVQFAYLVTTARFSAEARKQAKDMGIHLIDGPSFEERRTEVIRRAAGWQPLPSFVSTPVPPTPMPPTIQPNNTSGMAPPQISIAARTRPILKPPVQPNPQNTTPDAGRPLPPSRRIAVHRPFPIPDLPNNVTGQPTTTPDNDMPPRVDISAGQTALRDELMHLNKQIKARQRRIAEIDQAVGAQPTAFNGASSLSVEGAELNRQILLRQTRITEINKQLLKAPKK